MKSHKFGSREKEKEQDEDVQMETTLKVVALEQKSETWSKDEHGFLLFEKLFHMITFSLYPTSLCHFKCVYSSIWV